MISLVLSVICSMGCSMVYKSIGDRDVDGDSVMVVNYVTGSLIAFILCQQAGIFTEIGQIGSFRVWESLVDSFRGNVTLESSICWCVVIGTLHGILFVANLMVMRYNIEKSGASLCTMFDAIGNMLPVLAAILLFRELPGQYQWMGIFLAFASVFIANLQFGGGGVWNMQPILLLESLFVGWMGINNKIFQMCAYARYKNLLLLIVFLFAIALSLWAFRKKKMKFRGREIACGVIMGFPNMFSSFFLINALKTVPAAIVYPINSAGKIVLTFIVCSIVFKEKLRKQEYTAILLTIIGTVLVNLS